MSQGYNVSGADTCGFGAGAGDLPAAGDPVLGGLVSVGGPTAVRVPLAGSPLVSAIPPAACDLTSTSATHPGRSARGARSAVSSSSPPVSYRSTTS